MSCRLKNVTNSGEIKMRDLPGGKIAVMVQGEDKGILVQKNNANGGFVILGLKSRTSENSNGYHCDCVLKVRVLEEGELIEVSYS